MRVKLVCPHHNQELVAGISTYFCPCSGCDFYIHERILDPKKQEQYKKFEQSLIEQYNAGQVPGDVYTEIIILLNTRYIMHTKKEEK